MVSLRRFYTYLLVTVTMTSCLACGPTIQINSAFEERAPKKLAFLPVIKDQPIEPRKVSAIKAALKVELESKGFLFISDSIVESLCSNKECPERQKLFSEYNTDALVRLRLLDVSRNSFGIGYTNTIEGIVTLSDARDTILVQAEHSESERGGLLFDSGQIVRGLRDQIQSGGETYFKNLARGFARNLVHDFPTPSGTNQTQSDAITVSDVSISPFGFGFQKICSKGTPGKDGAITFGRVRSSLREISVGTYCAIVSIPANIRMASISLSSPWGSSAQQQVQVPPIAQCNIKKHLQIQKLATGSKVTLSCASLKNARTGACNDMISCSEYSLHIYRTNELPSPFSKLKQSGSSSWIDNTPLSKDTRYFGLLVDDRGFALPAFSITIPEQSEALQ